MAFYTVTKVYHSIVLKEDFSTTALIVIYFFLVLTFCGSYLRTRINVSSIVVAVTRRHLPDLLDPVLRVDPSDIPPPEPKRSLFSFSLNTHNHHYPQQLKNTTWGRRTGILIACSGLLVSSFTFYHTSQ